MNQTTYSYSKEVKYDFETAVQKAKEALKEEGFGILTTIDVKTKMKEKLDEDMEEYIILGACNPPSAYKVLQEEIEIGLLLPCNVIIYNKDGQTHVAAIRPTRAMSMINSPAIELMANDIEKKLKKALDIL